MFALLMGLSLAQEPVPAIEPDVEVTPPDVEIPCPNQVGSTARYDMSDEAVTPQGRRASARTFTLTVTEATEGQVTLDWSSLRSRLTDTPTGPMGSLAKALAEAQYPTVQVNVRVGEDDTTVEVPDLTALRTAMSPAVIEGIDKALRNSGVPSGPQRDAARRSLRETVLSDETLEQSIVAYVAPIFSFTCRTWPAGSITNPDHLIANPLGGPSIPATYALTVSPAAPDGSVTVHEVQRAEDVPVRLFVETFLRASGVDPDDVPGIDTMTLDMSVDSTLVVDDDGWLRSYDNTSQSSMMGMSNAQSSQWRRVRR